MSRSVALALLGAAAAVALLQACSKGPGREDVAIQRLQTVLCEKARACGCAVEAYGMGPMLECGGWDPGDSGGTYGGDTYYDDGYSDPPPPLAFDPACVERWVAWVDAQSCQQPELPTYAKLCPLYHGTLREGDACIQEEDSVYRSPCGRGLFCIADTCRDPRRMAFGGEDQPCDIDDRCDEGLLCLQPLCGRLPVAGEACQAGFYCDGDAYCANDLCVALPGPGERCDTTGRCNSRAFCRFDPVAGVSECQPLGRVGEPCRGHPECESGNCPAGVCEPPAGLGDPCGSTLPCGPGLFCRDGECEGDVDDVGDGDSAGSLCSVLEPL